MLLHRLARTHRHAVVVTENAVDVAPHGKYAVHLPVTFIIQPPAIARGNDVDAWLSLHGIHKAAMPLDGGRRAAKPLYLHHVKAFALGLRQDVPAHRLPHLIVVATDEGGVFLRVGLAVEQYHGYAIVVSAVYCRRHSVHLVGRDDKQVYAHLDETVYLRYLRLVVVARRNITHVDVVIQVCTAHKLVVELVAPVVFAALRHGDDILPVIRTRQQEQR